MARLNYLELPVGETARAKHFYATAFGWTFTDFGPTYAATLSGDTDVGLQADPAEQTDRALPVIEVADLTAAQAAVEQAGGGITTPPFAFPGGERFHFRDPDGHELAVVQPAAAQAGGGDAVQDPIERWHAYMRAGDVALLDGMIADGAVFRSPAVHTPQEGKAITVKYLTAAFHVLGNPSFRYTGEWRAADGRSAVLEFACEVGGRQVEGVDIIQWNAAGLIDDFKVIVRPLKGLQALMEAMGARLAG